MKLDLNPRDMFAITRPKSSMHLKPKVATRYSAMNVYVESGSMKLSKFLDNEKLERVKMRASSQLDSEKLEEVRKRASS